MPDLKGRLTEGTPGGNGLAGVRMRLLVERSGHKPVLLATDQTGDDGTFTASARVDASRNLHGRSSCAATPCAVSRPATSRSAAWADNGSRVARAARESARVPWTLVHADGTAEEERRPRRRRGAARSGEHFWLDIGNPEPDELDALAERLDLHPLVRDDLGEFGQRPKADDYPTTRCS